jgi:peptidoglycan/LPS O-acetylase OafA/YrhL
MAALELSATVLRKRPEGPRDAAPAAAPADGPEAPAAPGPALRGHLPALDGVRGLAILMVLLFHFVAQTTATNRLEAAVNGVLSYGLLGVDLFFVLSGFLITGILYDSRAAPGYFRGFYMRRVLRIFPLYYAVLAVVFFVLPLVPPLRGSEIAGLREQQAWAWLYGVNIYLAIQGGWVLSYIEHFWSLAVEEHFYLFWPVLVWWLARRPRALMGVALGLAAASFAARVAASLSGVSPVATTVLTPLQLDALCLGGFFAVWLRQPGGEAAVRRLVLPMALAAGAWLACDFALQRFGGFGLEEARAARGGVFRLGFAALLLQALFAPASSVTGRFFRSVPMIVLGKYSYGLYVYHHFLSYYMVEHGTEFAVARAVGSHTLAVAVQAILGMAASMAIAWLSYELFEKRFLELKRRFGRRPREAQEGGCRVRTTGMVVSTLGLALCLGSPGPARAAEAHAVERAPALQGYTIGLGDTLRIAVWKEPELTLDVTVRPDGMITMPLLGDVEAAGRSPGTLASTLTAELGRLVESPRVTVSVTQATSARVYVVGQMLRPGEFPLSGRMTVLKALALAGGFKEFARPENIVIVREDQTVIPFNYKRVAEGKDLSQNILLAAGDTILVP